MFRAGKLALMVLVLVLAYTNCAQAQLMARMFRHRVMRGGGQAGGTVALPYNQQDNDGISWMVYPSGWIRENSNQPIFSQAEMLTVNGNNPNSDNNLANFDPKTGELVLENMACGTILVTRRILITNPDMVRYIDIFKNTLNQDQSVSIMLQSTTNFGLSATELVSDPKHEDQKIGFLGMTPVNQVAVEMFAGLRAPMLPNLNAIANNNMVQASFDVHLPPNKSVAIMHLLTSIGNVDDGRKLILGMKDAALMRSLPPSLRQLIVNFPQGQPLLGDYELLRGDTLDVVELRGIDQIKGTIQETSFKLSTPYGPLDLPAGNMIAMVCAGEFRPRQLLVTMDGQIFGGRLQKDSISLQLSTGQTVQIPLNQITRMGYRLRPNEPQDWDLNKPFVLMRGGERMIIQPPAGPIMVHTRYGTMNLAIPTIAAVDFQPEDGRVHEIDLTDGSKFAGLVDGASFDLTLAGASGQVVHAASTDISRIQLMPKTPEIAQDSPMLVFGNQDVLVGSLTGQLKLDTAFDTLLINGPEVKHIVRSSPQTDDVQITLWDNGTVSGQLEDQTLHCQLNCGAALDVPVSLLAEYEQPLPRPSSGVVTHIKDLVAQLSGDDWKQRDQAQTELISIGPSVMPILNELHSTAAPEAQARIDTILKLVAQNRAASSTPTAIPVSPAPENGAIAPPPPPPPQNGD